MDAIFKKRPITTGDTWVGDDVRASLAEWARIYHFLELALAHPAEDGIQFFKAPTTEAELKGILADLLRPHVDARTLTAAGAFFAGLRMRNFDQIESDYIGLFSANFPVVPCPPYGSLYTVDENKRLEEILAIKEFYHHSGVDIAESFDDLPDHLCVELEFLQLLCFRLVDAAQQHDNGLAEGLRGNMTAFLDRFLLPFASRIAAIAARMDADNPYSHLLAMTAAILDHHRQTLRTSAASLPRSLEGNL